MDLEERIKRLESDMEHEKEMRKLHSTRMDANDTLLQAYQLRHAQAIEQHDRAIAEHDRAFAASRKEMKELRAIVGEIGTMLKNFIASMQAGTKNGRTE